MATASGTQMSGGLGSAGLTAGLDYSKVLFQPEGFHDSMAFADPPGWQGSAVPHFQCAVQLGFTCVVKIPS